MLLIYHSWNRIPETWWALMKEVINSSRVDHIYVFNWTFLFLNEGDENLSEMNVRYFHLLHQQLFFRIIEQAR